MAVESPGAFNSASLYGAEQTRRAVFGHYARNAGAVGTIAGGVYGSADLVLTAPGSGMSVNVSTGEAIIPGTTGATQSGYYALASSATNLPVAASSPSNPRVDLVCATVDDAAYSGAANDWKLQVVTGTPTAGATLTNLTGAPALPASSLLLGYILVPTSSVNVTAGNISNLAAQIRGGIGSEPAFSTYKDLPWIGTGALGPSTVAGTYNLAGGLITASGLTQVINLDPADYAAGSRVVKLRLKAEMWTVTPAPGQTFVFGLYPITGYSNGTGSAAFPNAVGAVVTGSTATFTTPGAASSPQAVSADFTCPAAGQYLLGFVIAGTTAAGQNTSFSARLQMRQT